jgi:hypothetical protein
MRLLPDLGVQPDHGCQVALDRGRLQPMILGQDFEDGGGIFFRVDVVVVKAYDVL